MFGHRDGDTESRFNLVVKLVECLSCTQKVGCALIDLVYCSSINANRVACSIFNECGAVRRDGRMSTEHLGWIPKQGVVWTQRTRAELEAAERWIELGPTEAVATTSQ